MTEDRLRDEIVARAFDWIDTPYQHQMSLKKAGCDCLGLVRGIYRELYGYEPAKTPPYSPDWAEKSGQETLLGAAQSYLQPLHKARACPGDVLVFRMEPQAVCKHVAIMSGPNSMIHAYWGRAVVESYMIPYWRRRWVYSFAFPPKNER